MYTSIARVSADADPVLCVSRRQDWQPRGDYASVADVASASEPKSGLQSAVTAFCRPADAMWPCLILCGHPHVWRHCGRRIFWRATTWSPRRFCAKPCMAKGRVRLWCRATCRFWASVCTIACLLLGARKLPICLAPNCLGLVASPMLVRCMIARLTLQERAYNDIADALTQHLGARGAACGLAHVFEYFAKSAQSRGGHVSVLRFAQTQCLFACMCAARLSGPIEHVVTSAKALAML